MNILQERYEFHHRQQEQNETLEDFVESIRQLATSCQFRSEEKSLIRDHVLFGLSDKNISMQIIQNGGDPSLSEVIEICLALSHGTCQTERSNRDVCNYDTGKSIENSIH